MEKEASLSYMIELSDSRALVRVNQRQLDRAKKEDAHRRIITVIPSFDVSAKYRKLQSLRHEETGGWILQDNLYQVWYKATSSSMLCCSGIPGSGKSILVSYVVEILRSDDTLQKASIVYYYCDYAD